MQASLQGYLFQNVLLLTVPWAFLHFYGADLGPRRTALHCSLAWCRHKCKFPLQQFGGYEPE